MAITTTFDPENYIVTVKTILGEFIQDALPEVNITFTYPQHLESKGAILPQPLVWIMDLPSETISIGSGKETGYGKAVKQRMHYAIYIIAQNSNEAGMHLVNQLSGKLVRYFLQHSDLLGKAKLKRAEITPPSDVLEWSHTNFVGARHSVFLEVLLMA